jgi:ParB/RepB/Spo0J family partition protein
MYQELPIDLLDQPSNAMREQMSDKGLSRLAESIRRYGLINPITVKPRGERYEIVAGHRRYVAHLMIGKLTIAANIREDGAEFGEALKVAENVHQEAINAAEEARYLNVLYETECDRDLLKLVALTGMNESYLNQRLTLLHGDPDVFEALRQGKIRFSVARELNYFKDVGYRRASLDWACSGGATARAIREQRLRIESTVAVQDGGAADASNASSAAAAVSRAPETCFVCAVDEDRHDTMYLLVHKSCYKHFVRPFLRGLKGESEDEHRSETESRGALGQQ